jgi:hypothetical protein
MQHPLGKRDLIAALVIPFVGNFDKAQLEAALKDVTDDDCAIFGDQSGPSNVRFRSAITAPDGTQFWEFTRINPGEFDPFKGMNNTGIAYWRFESWYAPTDVKFAK